MALVVAICYYDIDMYKYLALVLQYNDFRISLYYTLSVFFDIGSNYLAAFFW